MEEAKKEIDKTKKGMFCVVAFLLCVFFFMLPLVQFTQNTAGGNMLMVGKGGSLDLEASGSALSWSVSSTGDGSGPVAEKTTIAPSTTAKNNFTLKVDRNETETVLYVIVMSNESNIVDTMPIKVVQVTDITLNSSRAATGWKMATGLMDGKTPEEKAEGLADGVNIKPNFLVFVLLLIPLMFIGMVFTKFSFTFLRNISIIGPLAAVLFIIMTDKQYVFFTPTIFSWIVLILYLGLFAFMQYCHISEKNWKKNQAGLG
jgi:hypothetical protein